MHRFNMHVQVLAIQAAAQMEAVKLVEDATVIFIVTLWVTAARIFQRHVPGKINTLPLEMIRL